MINNFAGISRTQPGVMMNWKRKATFQNLVAALPGADTIYYAMQRTVGSCRPGRLPTRDWLEAAALLVTWVEGAGRSVVGGRFLEIGTGRNVTLPLALWLWGARSVVTVDLNTYLSNALVMESLKYLRAHKDEVTALFGARAETGEFKERFGKLMSFSGNLKSLMDLAAIRYLAPADAKQLPLPDHSFDFHVSHAVFEHIPAVDLLGILREARRLLVSGGLLYHVIDPSDHFSHDDASITGVNFLQFDDREWERLAGNRFTYHNRLRSFEHQNLLAQAGVRVIRQSETSDEASLLALSNGFPLHPQFSHVSHEALAVRSLNVLGTFADQD
ncbi:MAG TPA: methyltransferase domain-containing protein [Pyrinomonadaceae bacterium]|nr:methyltransferase domain-containing protein [Pyrinomonadaceae bacterium]